MMMENPQNYLRKFKTRPNLWIDSKHLEPVLGDEHAHSTCLGNNDHNAEQSNSDTKPIDGVQTVLMRQKAESLKNDMRQIRLQLKRTLYSYGLCTKPETVDEEDRYGDSSLVAVNSLSIDSSLYGEWFIPNPCGQITMGCECAVNSNDTNYEISPLNSIDFDLCSYSRDQRTFKGTCTCTMCSKDMNHHEHLFSENNFVDKLFLDTHDQAKWDCICEQNPFAHVTDWREECMPCCFNDSCCLSEITLDCSFAPDILSTAHPDKRFSRFHYPNRESTEKQSTCFCCENSQIGLLHSTPNRPSKSKRNTHQQISRYHCEKNGRIIYTTEDIEL